MDGGRHGRGTWRGGLRAAAILLLAIASPSFALDPAKALTQFTLRAWQAEQGLPQNSVQAVAQTPDGYLWLGTQEGLARFDGLSFTVFNHRNTEALAHDNVLALLADSAGVLWVGTEGGGLVRFAGGRFEALGAARGLPSEKIRCLCESPPGTLWVGTTGGGVARVMDGSLQSAIPASRLPNPNVNALCPDGAGGLWIGTYGGGVVRLGADGNLSDAGFRLPSAKVYTLLRDRGGTLWIGTEGGGLCAWRDGGLTVYGPAQGLRSPMIYALLEERGGTLWVGTYGAGLYRMSGGRFEALTSKSGLSNDVVLSLLMDREGSLWVGTYGGGVDQVSQGKFTPFGRPEGLPEDMVSCALQDRRGDLWIGTYGAGLCRLRDGRLLDQITSAKGLCEDSVYSLFEDAEGDLWAGTGRGVNRIRGRRVERFSKAEGFPGTMVYAIAQTPDGSLWFGLGGEGLARFRRGRFETLGLRQGLSNGTVVALLTARDGTLWVGTYGGLNAIRDGVVTAYGKAQGLRNPMVFSLLEDGEGLLWVGTYGGGLHLLKDGRLTAFGTAEGLLDDVVYSVLEDDGGRLWMSCNHGIFSVARDDLLMRAAGGTAPLKCNALGKADGMRSAECNGGTQPAGWKLADGRLVFPTVRGLVFLDPAHLPVNDLPPPVHIETVEYNRRQVPGFSDGLSLPPGRREIAFGYTAVAFVATDKVRFAYRLEGFESEWVDAGQRRTAYYTNIPPGKYRFQVKAANGDGVWNNAGASLSFRLEPHFYETRAFYALVILVALSAVAAGYLVRVNRLKARQRQLEALVKARTADLQEALEVVKSQGEELRVFNEELERKVREQLETIIRNKRLTKYFPRSLVDRILLSEEDVTLTTERRVVTTFFTDLTGFTRLSDVTDPDRITALLNDYLTVMVRLIGEHGGTLARFMGDGILGFFGAPDPMAPEVQAERAVRMALAMQEAMGPLGRRWGMDGGPDALRIRIGVHQDLVTLGNFGSPEHMEYTALGSGVNLAKRLESACPPGAVLVSAAIRDHLEGSFAFGPEALMTFKGFERPVATFTVLGPS